MICLSETTHEKPIETAIEILLGDAIAYTSTFQDYLAKARPNMETPYIATNDNDISHVIKVQLFSLVYTNLYQQ